MNLIEIMNQTSIWIDKALAVSLYAIATRVVMIGETSSTVLRSTATGRQLVIACLGGDQLSLDRAGTAWKSREAIIPHRFQPSVIVLPSAGRKF